MPRDTAPEAKLPRSEATRRRLLAAALDEFTEFGLAGARVDRISARAGANKRLIYLYFGNKEQLFDAVIDEHKSAMEDTLHFDVDDLPGFAVELFDYFIAHPFLLRLSMWRFLERRSDSSEAERRMYVSRLTTIADAQRSGRLPTTFAPEELINFSMALITNWATASADADPATMGERRETLRHAIANLVHGRVKTPSPTTGRARSSRP